MAQDLTKKLLLHKAQSALLLHLPENLQQKFLEELPPTVTLLNEHTQQPDFLLLFVQNHSELRHWLETSLLQQKNESILWIAYPKKSSKLPSDLSRDSLQVSLRENGVEGVTLISIDDTWSAMRVKPMKND